MCTCADSAWEEKVVVSHVTVMMTARREANEFMT